MKGKYYLIIVLAAFIYATYLVLNRFYLLGGLEPLSFAAGSALFSGIFSFLYLLASGRTGELKELDKKMWLYIILLSLIVASLSKIFFFLAQSMVTATNTGFLMRISPVFALLFGYIFLKEKLTKRHILVIMVMIFGAYLLASGGSITIGFGEALLLFVAVFIGLDHAFSRKLIKMGVSPGTLTSLRLIVAAIALSPLFMFSSFSLIGWTGYLLSGLLVFLSIFFRNIGLKHVKAGIGSSILLLSPVFSAIMGIGFLDEKVVYLQLAGGVIILAGAYLLSRIKSE